MQFCYFAKVIITRHSKVKRNYNHTPTMHSHVTFFEMTRTRAKRVRVMVFDDSVNNISIISWRSVLLVEETGTPGKNH